MHFKDNDPITWSDQPKHAHTIQIFISKSINIQYIKTDVTSN